MIFDNLNVIFFFIYMAVCARVRITNLSNGKTCEARVVDRGPFSIKRLIDVSSAVARDLGFLRKGLQQVRVEVVSVGDEPHQLKAELDD